MDSQTEGPLLSQVIGAIVSSVAHARSVADTEALRIASVYRENDLLKGLPVPRLRVRSVQISLPVIISSVTQPIPGKLSTPHEIATAAGDALFESIAELVKKLRIEGGLDSIDEDEKRDASFFGGLFSEMVSEDEVDPARFVPKALLDRKETYVSFIEVEIEKKLRNPSCTTTSNEFTTRTAIGDAVAEATAAVIGEVIFEKIREYVSRKPDGRVFDPKRARRNIEEFLNEGGAQLVQAPRRAAESTAFAQDSVPPDLKVAVDTDKIKNAGGGPEIVTRLTMNLLEEGLEWSSDVSTGADKLTVE